MSLPRPGGSPPPTVAELCFQIFDLAVRVHLSDQAVATRVSHLLDSFATDAPIRVASRNTFYLVESEDRLTRMLTRDGNLVAQGDAWAPLIAALVAELNTSAVAEMRCFAAHAGAVAGNGTVLAFPSASGTGKSTFTAACLLAGFEYVSDEALCLDFDAGEVLPYPKPISLSSWSMNALGLSPSPETTVESLLSPRDLGAVAVHNNLPLHHVVLMDRGPGTPELEELSRSEVVALLLRNSFNHYKHPEKSFRLLTKIAQDCRAWRMRFDDPMEAAQMVDDRFRPR